MTAKDVMKRLLSLTRKAVQDYDMIKEGARVCVGLSGGKDSMTLLAVLAQLRRFYPKQFDLQAVHVSLGFKGVDSSPLRAFCESLEVPLEVVDTQIAEIVFDVRQEHNPCALCANLRRGALNSTAKSLGCDVVALAHHKDDVIETAMLSLFFEGRFYCFEPDTWLERAGVHVIRPFLFVEEREIKQYARLADVPVVANPCPADRNSERARMKQLLRDLPVDNEMLRTNIFGAVKRDIWNRPE
ncbi:MAG: tRNA 2-thiocytidine biosynthesis protein TtcA [Clostridia bacterium]|nr:tRNA 2-thiocytidine biosynthesis protein TtcA [Clostridia bacterium]